MTGPGIEPKDCANSDVVTIEPTEFASPNLVRLQLLLEVIWQCYFLYYIVFLFFDRLNFIF